MDGAMRPERAKAPSPGLLGLQPVLEPHANLQSFKNRKVIKYRKPPMRMAPGAFFNLLPFFFHLSSFHYRPQQLVTPSVVAMAVRIEMAI